MYKRQGIRRLDLQGVVKDYLKIEYDKGDSLYVPVTQLDIVSRYTAPGDGERVKLAKLGGDAWAKDVYKRQDQILCNQTFPAPFL